MKMEKGLHLRIGNSGKPFIGRAFPYLLLLPSLIPIIVILLYPIAQTIVLSTFKINMLRPLNDRFVGFENYIEMVQTPSFWLGITNSFRITFFVVLGSLTLGLVFSMLLNMPFKGRGIFRSLIIIPWAAPAVAAVLVWLWILDFQFGVLNYILRTIGLAADNIQWLTNTSLAVFSVIIVIIWKQFGISTIMLLAGLQTIDPGLYEASMIDGANVFVRFCYITLPGLRTSGGVLILLITVWTFREFTILQIMTQGGPARATETLVLQTYLEAFKFYSTGSAAALGMVTFCISIIISIVYYKALLSKRGDE